MVEIGALVTPRASRALGRKVAEHAPLLAQAPAAHRRCAHPQPRNPLCGSIAFADPAAELAGLPLLLVLGGEVEATPVRTGKRNQNRRPDEF